MTKAGTSKCACGKTISANAKTCAACVDKPTGELSILNVGSGDVRISFNTASVSEVIRAKRIVTDMLRRGYALIVEVERNGERAWERVQEFDEKRGEYVVADFDALAAREADMEEDVAALKSQHQYDDTAREAPVAALCKCGRPAKHRGACQGVARGRKRLPMESTKATAVGRSAGG